MSRIITVLLVSAVVVLGEAFGTVAGASCDSSVIRPHQNFGGLVNGSRASATVRMACFGPIRPGQTGHPMANQPLEVIQGAFGGYTGSRATSIVARFREDPSVGVQFTHYGVAEPIPTSLELPCDGQGLVIFSPEPSSSTAKAATVTVNYVGQP